MRPITLIQLLLFCFLLPTHGQLQLIADYTDNAKATKAIQYPLNVFNRTTPVDGFNIPLTANAKLCIVRPLGGIYKNGGADLSLDSYLWDETNKKFYTDFTILKKQIDGVLNKGIGIHQLLLDNPSWAFQRDSLGNFAGGEMKVETYGNAEPPRDYNTWAAYLKEVMNFLITTYGEAEVQKIQFGIGREIGTKGHWTGTKEQFFEFYKKSVEAVHQVLPTAKVGSHFLWGTSDKCWAVDFVKWCKANQVHYDVLGVSYYPFYNQISRTYFPQVYNDDFGVIKDIPEWNSNAVFEIHEFALIEKMNAKGNGYESADAKHQNAFMVGMMKILFENNIKNLFLWGTGEQYMPAINEILKHDGNVYYKSSKEGQQRLLANYVDAIFTKDTIHNIYKVMAYNYNASPTSNSYEDVNIVATIDVPPGTNIKYRSAVYDKSNNTLPWSAWQYTKTEGEEPDKSTLSFNQQLPVFSFLSYEFNATDEEPEKVDSTTLINKLIFYYPLEEDGNDSSGKKNNATVGEAVAFSSAKVGNGAAFSYTEGSFLSSADSVFKYSYPTAYTFAFWLKVSDYGQRSDIIQPINGRTLLYSNGDLSFKSFHQKKSISFEVSNDQKDNWFHVAMVIDQREGQTKHQFYVNGVQRGSTAEGYALETEKPQSVGRIIFGSSSETQLQRNFTGILDEIYLFDDVLSDMETNYVMNSQGLVGHSSENTGSYYTKLNNNIRLFPVPVKNTLNVEGIAVMEAQLYNVLGSSVKKYKTPSNQLDVTFLNTGMYILKITDEKGYTSLANFTK